MNDFFDANYRITDLRTEKGKIVDLGINNKHIDLSNYDENKTVTITENGRIEVIPSKDKKGMKKVTVTTNVQQNLDENKEHTIDASLYDSPIEINPLYEKDGMKKSNRIIKECS